MTASEPTPPPAPGDPPSQPPAPPIPSGHTPPPPVPAPPPPGALPYRRTRMTHMRRPPSQEQISNANHVVFIAGQSEPVVSTPAFKKSLVDAYLLAIPLGFLGLHHFYLKRQAFGVLYIFTFGLLGFGWILDWFRLPYLVHSYNQKQERRTPGKLEAERKTLMDAYTLWFSPFGFLGFHHYYLERYVWGVAYTVTFGFLGLGWLLDGARMFYIVKQANIKLEEEFEGHGVQQKHLMDAYVLGFAPCGLLGAHHYYLQRYKWGLLYTFTLGLFGCGWIGDWFRMKYLVDRANAKLRQETTYPQKYYDDAYILWFPLGFLGLHHFYLKRYYWGLIYVFTFGILGLGWLADAVRLPYLVRDTNKRLAAITIVTCIIPPNGREPIVTRHPAGDVRISVPGDRGQQHVVTAGPHQEAQVIVDATPPTQDATPVYPSGVVLQPPSYEDSQPPSYEDSVNTPAQGCDNQGYVPSNQQAETQETKSSPI